MKPFFIICCQVCYRAPVFHLKVFEKADRASHLFGRFLATFAWRDGFAMRTGLRVAKESTHILFHFLEEKVLKLAAHFVDQSFLHGQDIHEKSFRQTVASNDLLALLFAFFLETSLLLG